MKRAWLAACLLTAVAGLARAEVAESLATPTFRQPRLLQFKVADTQVSGISVLVMTTARDGRVDRQIFELGPWSSKGAFPDSPGYQMWESDKIYAAHDQWRGNLANLDRVDFTYVVHRAQADGSQNAVESKHIYRFTDGQEIRSTNFASSTFARVGDNRGRRLEALDERAVQAAVDRLAHTAPAARFVTLPGTYPHPDHPENELVNAIQTLAGAKKAHPERDYFLRVAIFNQDSPRLADALIAAHRAGVRVEELTEWTQVTPRRERGPVHEALRVAGIPLTSLVRNGPTYGDIRSNHSKFWILGEMRGGQIAQATTYDCSFNTEFANFPGNQEAMTVFPNNADVATVYNHFFQAMKGGAPLRLRVDPERANFIVAHPLYPYRAPDGTSFGAKDLLLRFLGKARQELVLLDYIHADREIAEAAGQAARRGATVDVFVNGWKVHNDNGRENIDHLHSLGANVHLVHHQNGGSPMHHKAGVADGEWVRAGSLNPGWWSFQSDETLHVIRSREVAQQVFGAAERLAHRYPNEHWGRSRPWPGRRR